MELGLGLRTCFSLETKNPIFVNFKLSEGEAQEVKKWLTSDVTLCKIRFCESDSTPEYWVSYNLYELKYPKKELQSVHKVRCEINTFVEDSHGRKGVFVFCGSPYVSKENKFSIIGAICDFAERVVVFIYGCGKVISLDYELTDRKLHIDFTEGNNQLRLTHEIAQNSIANERLSDDYWVYNDISFFNGAKTFDLVNVNSAFYAAKLHKIAGQSLSNFSMKSPFFRRAPDNLYFHRGEIAYIVNSLNRSAKPIASTSKDTSMVPA